MKPKATEEKVSTSLPILTQVIRKSLFICLLLAGIVPAICFIFGWRSLESIGSGFIYGSLGLILFGVLMLAGNPAPAHLSKLSLPKYNPPSLKRHQEVESDGPPSIKEGVRFLFATLISGAFLFLIGFFLKMLS